MVTVHTTVARRVLLGPGAWGLGEDLPSSHSPFASMPERLADILTV